MHRTIKPVVPAAFACAAILVASTACGSGSTSTVKVPDDPLGTVQTVVHEIARNQPEVLWAALPTSYRDDVHGLVHDFADKVDADLYDQSFRLMGKVVGVLRDKRDFILDHPMARKVDDAKARANWDSVVAFFDVIAKSELRSVASLRSLDIGGFLRGDGRRLMESVAAISKLSPEDPMATLHSIKAELVSSAGGEAQLRLTVPGKPSEEVELVRAQGRWLPVEMVEGWDEAIADARQGLAEMPGKADQESIAQAKMMMGMAEAIVDQLAAAKTQKEFNAALGSVMGMAMGAKPGRGR